MSVQRLDRTLTCYRIGDPDGDHPIFDATGSTIDPGRWNDRDTPVIYCAEHYSTAMLEKLAHLNFLLPRNQHYITIILARGMAYEMVTPATCPQWASADLSETQALGTAWVAAAQSGILLVPSVVARIERNVLLNPAHPEFAQIEISLAEPVWWDKRLFGD